VEPAAGQIVPSGWLAGIGHRVFGLLFLGVPGLWGLRNPWSADYTLSILILPVLALYLGSIVYAIRVRNPSRFLPMTMGGSLVLVLLATPFGNDATGRYLLPLYLPVVLLAAELIRALGQHSRWLAAAAMAWVLAFNIGATLTGALTPPAGMTAQLDARFQFGNKHDTELITFLQEQGERCGYANFWVAYKITFLSDESIIVAARLPFKEDLVYSEVGDQRYPAYSRRVDESTAPPFFITSNQPNLDERLREVLAARQIQYSQQVIGSYHLYYGLSETVTPEQLGLQMME
jgi:hypothetical protein